MDKFDQPLPHDLKRRYLVHDRSKPICSSNLFAAGNEILIEHQGEQYRLRLTRNGRLILTK
jgi:hemin uptake protein HemP